MSAAACAAAKRLLCDEQAKLILNIIIEGIESGNVLDDGLATRRAEFIVEKAMEIAVDVEGVT